MVTKDPYGVDRAKIVRGNDSPFVSEPIYTNDPDAMVKHCLNCTSLYCDRGECAYTKKGEGHKKRIRRTQPPAAADVINRIAKMWMDGWRKSMIARELDTTIYIVERSLAWAEKEGLI